MHGSNIEGPQAQPAQAGRTLDYFADLARRSLSAADAVLWCLEPTSHFIENGLRPSDTDARERRQALCRQVKDGNQLLATSGDHDETSGFAFLGVPVRDRSGASIGALGVCVPGTRVWRPEDLRLMGELAEAVTLHIERVKQTERRSDERSSHTGDIQGLMFERRKVAGGGWTYTFFGPSRQILPDFNGRDGHDQTLGFVHLEDRQRVRESIERALAAEVDVAVTFRLAPDGYATRWVRSQSVVRREPDGTAVWHGLCLDISDLVAAREAAEDARVATDMLLVDVNHELRTPLQSILGFTELLNTEVRPDMVRNHAALIQTSARSLLTIVNQLLELASGEQVASRQVSRHPLDIRALAGACHGMVAPLAAEKGIASALVLDEDVPPYVLADGPKIQQVLVNLLNNAIKFTEAGSVALRVSRHDSGLRFSVSDTGIGIAEDKVDLLFQRFSRLEPGQRSERGTGLGLAIAKQLVEAMDGEIGVSSTLARGTTFWVDLTAEAVVAPAAEPAAPPEPGSSRGGGTRILLADDLDLNRKLIADMLSLEGYEVDCVGDGADALRAAGDHAYDLILMDMIMPGMDGLTAARGIRALPAPTCDVPIIALTAHSFKEQLDSCIAAGMNDTLTKPMSLDALVSTVRSWTEGRSRAA